MYCGIIFCGYKWNKWILMEVKSRRDKSDYEELIDKADKLNKQIMKYLIKFMFCKQLTS